MLGSHWLRTAATRAGVPGSDSLAIPPGTPAPEAWALACTALGVTEESLAAHVARHFRLSVADFGATMASAVQLVPETVVRKHTVLPLREDDREIHVATCDPTDFEAEQALGFATGRQPVFRVAGPTTLKQAIDARYAPDLVVQPLLTGVEADGGSGLETEDPLAFEVAAAHEGESTSVVRLTNMILRSAIGRGASLIELAPGQSGGLVRFRIDTVMRHYMQMPLPALNHVVSRVKILGNVGFGARARSQDGSARLRIEGRAYDLRITILPERGASKASIRVIDVEYRPGLADLAMSDHALARVRALFGAREGLILVASPSGHGKTTTLTAAVRELPIESGCAISVEDPIEQEIPGLDQRQVDRRSGATVASTLRTALEGNPTIVMVGEIADAEAAQAALDAAEERLVVATIPADRAADALARTLDARVSPDHLAARLRGIVGQRLLQRLCPACARPATAPLEPEEVRLERLYSTQPVRRPVGCPACEGTGYRGVVPIVQVMLVTPKLAERIALGETPIEIEHCAVEGGLRTLLTAAQERVATGETSIQELDRVIGPGRDAEPTLPAEPLVLVADDDPETVLLARAVLEQNGLRVVEANDGADALDRIGDGRDLSLVVLDLNMPKVDGRQVLKRLKASVSTAGLPVVVLTGSRNPEDEVLVMEEGAADYIRKPIDPPRFLARIKAALRRHGGDRVGA
jgi:type II secretory ATPase GspE/PulE/Tfp pilus assembly ATPase PilB-like protein/CheY-like chemotaxis protein